MGQPAIEELVHDLSVSSRRTAAVQTLVELGTVAEPTLLDSLTVVSSATRSAIYEVLTTVGTERSVLPLQQALLVRDSFEQRLIERALNGIYGRMKATVPELEPSVNSSRIYGNTESAGDW